MWGRVLVWFAWGGGMAGRSVLWGGVKYRGTYRDGDSGRYTSGDDYGRHKGATMGADGGASVNRRVGRSGVTHCMLVTLLTSH